MENVARFVGYGPCIQKRDNAGRPMFVRIERKGKKTRFVKATPPTHLQFCPSGMNVRTWWKRAEEEGFLPYLVPDKARAGEYFREIIEDIRACGYDVQWRLISSADFGPPQNRVRFFLQAVRLDTKKKIFWPEASFGKRSADGRAPAGRRPWRSARECIDLSDVGTPLLGRQRPLAANTLRRIAYGFINHALAEILGKVPGFDGSQPVVLNLHEKSGVKRIALSVEPRVAPTRENQTPGASSGFVLPQHQAGEWATSLDVPFRTIAGAGAEALVHAFLVSAAHGNDSDRPEENFRRVRSLDEPFGAITGGRDWAVASAFLVPNFGERPGQTPRTHTLDAPLPTVTSHGAGGVVTVMLADALSDATQRVSLSVGTEEFGVVFLYRLCRIRELARAQSFPEDFIFEGTTTEVLKQIGNAVPPLVAWALFSAYLKQSSKVGLPTGRLASTLRSVTSGLSSARSEAA